SERQAGLIADALLGGSCSVAGGVEARNRVTPLVDHSSMDVGEQANRGAPGRMQLDAVKRRVRDGSEAAIDIAIRRGCRSGEFPLVFAAMKIIVHAGRHKSVEAADCFRQLDRVNS